MTLANEDVYHGLKQKFEYIQEERPPTGPNQVYEIKDYRQKRPGSAEI